MTMNNIEHLVRPKPSTKGAAPNTDSLGSILVEAGKIKAEDVEQVMALQNQEGWRFGEAAMRLSLISETDLTQALHRQYDMPVLQPDSGGLSEELVAAYQPYHQRTEELRALRTQLLIRWYRRPGTDHNILAVVSPNRGEGRSYVAANLAILFAQLGERTLLIDADLRNPRQQEIFQVCDRGGLAAVLAGRAGPEAAVPIPGIQNLMLLPAGAIPPNPLELLSRPSLPELLMHYLGDFDIILVDTPPALPYSDAQTIGFRAGSALVVTQRDETRISHTRHVIRELGNCGTRVVGTVINAH